MNYKQLTDLRLKKENINMNNIQIKNPYNISENTDAVIFNQVDYIIKQKVQQD